MSKLVEVDRACPPEKCDPLSEQRIGEQSHSVELNEDGRMTDIEDGVHGREVCSPRGSRHGLAMAHVALVRVLVVLGLYSPSPA